LNRRGDAEPPAFPPTTRALVPVGFTRQEFAQVEAGAARLGLRLTEFIVRAALEKAAAACQSAGEKRRP
jgi:hypothetical protein